MNEASKVVLDASALMVLIAKENGWENVLPLLTRAVISCINLAEVAKILIARHGMQRQAVQPMIERLLAEVVPFDNEQAYVTAELALNTRQYGLSLGDRACLALAKIQGCTVYTADKAWKNVKIDGIEIELVR